MTNSSNPEPKPEVTAPPIVKEPASKPQDKSSQNNKNQQGRGNSLLKGMLGKFIKKDENVKQMILPEKEQ